MSWTEEKVEKLKELWGKKTASEIAQIIGNVSRNAIIGKAHRLNLSLKFRSKKNLSSNFIKSKNPVEKQNLRKDRKSKFKSLIIDKNFEPENPKTLEELDENTCKWPIGHPNEKSFYFCGRTSLKDFSYCKLHLLYAFQQKNDKKENITINKEDGVPKFLAKKIKSA
tara:strand:- start:646 stop:1146 length:501 start_codon:yes stop_codon:yes gene_type:complete